MMTAPTGYGHRRELGNRMNGLCVDGDEKNNKLWEAKSLGHLQLLGLKEITLNKAEPNEEEENEDDQTEMLQMGIITVEKGSHVLLLSTQSLQKAIAGSIMDSFAQIT